MIFESAQFPWLGEASAGVFLLVGNCSGEANPTAGQGSVTAGIQAYESVPAEMGTFEGISYTNK